ncbi:MAG: hypothetical protein JJO39_15800 [Escherichia coli]|nr:hypothetical protein [Escherichia coli]
MMATEYTPNYNLDLYASADKPNLRDQYNAAMGKIDTQMKKSADDVTNANANVLTLQTQMTEAQKDISALESTVETHGTQITDVQKTADDALSLAKTNESDIADTQADVTSLTGRVTKVEGTANNNKTDIASLDTRMGEAEGNITEAQNNINELQTTVNQKAPINHASTANTYGQGSSTNFGHLKVADSGSVAASSGTAASPKMVTDQINALKSALAPTALITARTVNYSGGISGSGTFSVYANSITKVVSVQLDNTSIATSGSGGWKSAVLGTIPTGYRPTRLMTQSCFSGWGFLYVDSNGQVRLSVSDAEAHSAGTENGVGLVYFAAQ